MNILFTDERSTFIAKGILRDDCIRMSLPQFICLRKTVASYPEKNTVIFDIDCMNEDIHLVGMRIREVLNDEPTTRFICFAPGFEKDSAPVRELRAYGVRSFITSTSQAEMKKDLKAALADETTVPLWNIKIEGDAGDDKMPEEPSPAEDNEDKSAPEEPEIYLPDPVRAKTIAVIGTMPRIGTTTQAVQLALSIKSAGASVCYVEMNPSGMLTDIRDAYSLRNKGGYVTAGGIDMYFYRENCRDLYRRYDHIVFDYGHIRAEGDLLSYFEKDLHVLVAGTSPGETKSLSSALRRLTEGSGRLHIVFSFTPDDDRKAVIRQVRRKAAVSCSFPDYTPDMFTEGDRNITDYLKILSVDGTSSHGKGILERLLRRR